MSGINYKIKNQVIISGEDVYITSGQTHNNDSFIGSIIIVNHKWHVERWFGQKHKYWFVLSNFKLASTLPPSLNFKIYEHELY